MIKVGETIRATFVYDDGGEAVNLDGGASPTVTLMLNNATNGASVTVSNGETGVYHVSATVPSASEGDQLRFRAVGTLGGVSVKQFSDPEKVVDRRPSEIYSQYVIRANTAQAGASGSITLDASASSVTNFYRGQEIYLRGGTGSGQARIITAYNGSTKVATVLPVWGTTPDNTTTFDVRAARGPVPGSDGKSTLSDDDAGWIALISFTRDEANVTDKYLVELTRNAAAVSGSITSPTITVRSAAGVLINAATLTQISGNLYKYDAVTSERQTLGVPCGVSVTATVDGTSRTFTAPDAGRDSAA